jgi:hypothetical protein
MNDRSVPFFYAGSIYKSEPTDSQIYVVQSIEYDEIDLVSEYFSKE